MHNENRLMGLVEKATQANLIDLRKRREIEKNSFGLVGLGVRSVHFLYPFALIVPIYLSKNIPTQTLIDFSFFIKEKNAFFENCLFLIEKFMRCTINFKILSNYTIF